MNTDPDDQAAARTPLLSVRNLSTSFAVDGGTVQAVRDVSWDIYPGEVLGVVGESGSGKSVSVASVLGLLPSPPATVTGGSVTFDGRDLLTLPDRLLRRIRGREISMIFQDPMTSFNPVQTIGHQLAEVIRVHDHSVSRAAARDRVIELLDLVGVPSPAIRYAQFPHEYSGGMRQRAMIAMAMANRPKLIIADEPTTALDVTIQAQILEILQLVQRETDAAVVLITHDLGLIAELADRVLVMYAGKVVESADMLPLFQEPRHPYTLGLLASLPRLDAELDQLLSIPGSPPNLSAPPSGCAFHPRCALSRGRELCRTDQPALLQIGAAPHHSACHFSDEMERQAQEVAAAVGLPVTSAPVGSGPAAAEPPARPEPSRDDDRRPEVGEELLRVEALTVHFPIQSSVVRRTLGQVRAVDDVGFTLAAGETLGLVGESGSGKSTTAQAILRLVEPTAGRIVFRGQDVTTLSRRAMRPYRRNMQIVLQDPFSSLDPRMTVGTVIAEPLKVHRTHSGAARRKRVEELLELVGLQPEHASRFPHEFSGGQRQRIGIARALALDPQLLVLDEPVSALDVSIQAQIVNLLERLQDEMSLAYLFIAHDLSVIKHICDRVAVMYLGRIVETGSYHDVYERPTHPYTQALLSAVPTPDPAQRGQRERIILQGDIPSPADPPSGCRFRTRCWKAQDICAEDVPELIDRFGHGHPSACLFAALRDDDEPVAAAPAR